MSNDRTFTIAAGLSRTIDIKITEVPGVKAENLGLKTWGAAFILANQIGNLRKYAPQRDNEPLQVLEIGAGTGLAGIAAAMLWKADVVITDLPSIIPGMQANIDINLAAIKSAQGRVRCGTLDWAQPDYLIGSENDSLDMTIDNGRFQTILAADTLYSEDHPGLMATTIFRWLAQTKDASFIVCYAQRIAYLDHIRELWSLLEDGGLQSVQEGIEVGDASWDEEAPFEWTVFKWKHLLNIGDDG